MIADPVPPPAPLSYRPREAARLLGISARTLYEWTRAGHVPFVRVSPSKRSAVLYPARELQAWLTRRAAESAIANAAHSTPNTL